ncbi:hypothetical protein [Deinococcus sp. 6GRE01]|uniref:hypothetical protein n=1 Tax=Deinococcus sp. 6GRE01 TaxID=2745873 RepID=UPI001E42E7D7|nr:hypothetical protein [Deinococcus sp. 6GRE01]MCD0156098.1 hypothetical protein [Deinococcus sp. 6GRE01]
MSTTAVPAPAEQAAALTTQGTPAHELAVLAREWTQLHEVQHALREAGVPYQLYNVRDQLRLAASLIGSALRAALTAQPDRHASPGRPRGPARPARDARPQ